MKPKAELMAEHRQRLRDRGLVPVQVWVHDYDRQRLARYVRNRLDGHAPEPPTKPER